MGSCDSKKKSPNYILEIRERPKLTTTIKDHLYQECISENSTIRERNPKRIFLSKQICKIRIGDSPENQAGKTENIGFLLKFLIKHDLFYCIMTNEHILKKEILINKNSYIIINNEAIKDKKIIINEIINKKKRFVKHFADIGLDIAIVEILEEDKIPKEYFLYAEQTFEKYEPDVRIMNHDVYIPHYNLGRLSVVEGKIKNINNYTITYSTTTDFYNSGSPIFVEDRMRVVGIHIKNVEGRREGYGNLIDPIIKLVKIELNKIVVKGKYIDGKYIYENGKYYEGELGEYIELNKDIKIPHGEGIKFYKNGNAKYYGTFFNGKYHGNGKLVYENGDYYIGQFRNGLIHGEGKEYYFDGNILYDGDWTNNEYEEDRSRITIINDEKERKYEEIDDDYDSEDLSVIERHELTKKEKHIRKVGYYVGQWQNGIKHGYGILFYNNGKVKQKGLWKEGVYIGNLIPKDSIYQNFRIGETDKRYYGILLKDFEGQGLYVHFPEEVHGTRRNEL